MTILTIFFILLSVSFSVIAQILLKHGMSTMPSDLTGWYSISYHVLTNFFIILGLASYGMSMVVWLYVLSKVDVSRAYPFVGLGFIGTMVFAHYFLNEAITLPKIIGTLLVILGVILLAR